MKIQKIKINAQRYSWLVLGDDYLPIKPVQSFIRYLENLERSPHTLRSYANHLKLYFEYLKYIGKSWETVRLDDLAEFIHWLRLQDTRIIHLRAQESKRTETTVNAIITAVSSFYQFHQQLGHTFIQLTQTTTQPYRRYKPLLHHISKSRPIKSRLIKLKQPKSLPKTLTSAQVEGLLKACRSVRDQFLIGLLYESGLRIGQALGLRHGDIKSWDNEIHCQPRNDNLNDARSKTRTPLIIHVTADLMALYTHYLLEEFGSIESDYVFVQIQSSGRGTPLNYRAVRDLFARLSKKINFPVTPHMLRHTHATELIRDGWDCAYVQKRLGHASVQTTLDAYAHLSSDDLKKAFKAYQKSKERGTAT
jgi:integrase/recombinase XerD